MPPEPPRKRHPYAQWAPDARALDLVGDKWTLLIVRDLADGPRRFVDLQRVLPGISREQLRSRLNRMVADNLLSRTRYRELPPRVDYELTARSRELLPVIGALARWGYDWTWTAPREGEAIDIGAILRSASGFLAFPQRISGTAELVVEDEAGATCRHTLEVHRGNVTIRAGSDGDADVRIDGDRSDWIAALGPAADLSGLEVNGDRRLAEALLGGIGAPRTAPDSAAEVMAEVGSSY